MAEHLGNGAWEKSVYIIDKDQIKQVLSDKYEYLVGSAWDNLSDEAIVEDELKRVAEYKKVQYESLLQELGVRVKG